MKQPIVGFHQDEAGDWVAELSCGHGQHIRHNPPLAFRPWVLTAEGRARFLGYQLECVRCDEVEHDERQPAPGAAPSSASPRGVMGRPPS